MDTGLEGKQSAFSSEGYITLGGSFYRATLRLIFTKFEMWNGTVSRK